MPLDDRLQVQTIVKRLLDGQAERVELNQTRTVDAAEYRLERWIQNSTDGAVVVNLGLLSSIKFLHIRGEYQDADLPNNIEKFDPARIEVQLNDPGAPWDTIDALTFEGDITSLSVRIDSGTTQDIRITLILGGDG